MGWVVFSAVEGTWRECGLQFPSSFRIHILEVMIDYEGFFFHRIPLLSLALRFSSLPCWYLPMTLVLISVGSSSAPDVPLC